MSHTIGNALDIVADAIGRRIVAIGERLAELEAQDTIDLGFVVELNAEHDLFYGEYGARPVESARVFATKSAADLMAKTFSPAAKARPFPAALQGSLDNLLAARAALTRTPVEVE